MQKPTEINFKQLKQELLPRPSAAHKGLFGHVVVIGGDFGYAGAPVMSAMGASRVGAGLVTIATHQQNLVGLNAMQPEIMTANIDDPANIAAVLQKATVVILGPGLGRSAWSEEVFLAAINTKLPLILDADGLYFLGKYKTERQNWVLTPHPGEGARLLNQTSAIDIDQRIASIEQLATQYNATVALKGAGTLVVSPDSQLQICPYGNPGMASGGMGDLLCGVIAGLIAQGMKLDSATKLAVCLHALAGDKIAQELGQRGMLATDLLPVIRKLLD